MTGLGIALALLAAVANAWAVVLQAAEDRQSPDEEAMRATLLIRLSHRPRWLGGTGLMIVAGVAQVAALAFAPIAVVQPALAADQLVLLGVARFRLGEHVGPWEVGGAAAIMTGLVAVILAAPHDVASTAPLGRLAPPLALLAGGALLAYVLGRARPAMRLLLVLGAGLAYAAADFGGKLLSISISDGRILASLAWVGLMVLVGAVAFLEETTALQHRPAVTVAPVIGAVKIPLPVLMALWAGMEPWSSHAGGIAVLVLGLALAASGAAILGRSGAVARVGAGAGSAAGTGGGAAGGAGGGAGGGREPAVQGR